MRTEEGSLNCYMEPMCDLDRSSLVGVMRSLWSGIGDRVVQSVESNSL